jgi:hypothetical protein
MGAFCPRREVANQSPVASIVPAAWTPTRAPVSLLWRWRDGSHNHPLAADNRRKLK